MVTSANVIAANSINHIASHPQAPSATDPMEGRFAARNDPDMSMSDRLDQISTQSIESLPTPLEREIATDIRTAIEMACESEEQGAQAASQLQGPAREFAKALHEHLGALRRASPAALDPIEIKLAVTEFVSKVLNNKFESTFGRWGANVTVLSLTFGLNAGVATVFRQMFATLIEYTLVNEHVNPEVLNALGLSAQFLGPVLNVSGGIRDELRGTATNASRVARAAMLAFSVGTIAASAGTSTAGSMVAAGFATWLYSGGRGMQVLFPIVDNAGGLTLKSTVQAGACYGAVQFAGCEAMDQFPESGAGAVHGPGQPYPINLRDNLARGGINGAIETIDAIVSGSFRRQEQIKKNRAEIPAHQLTVADTEGYRVAFGTPLFLSDKTWKEKVQALLGQLFTTEAQRSSAFGGLTAGMSALTPVIDRASISDANKGHTGNLAVAGIIFLVYAAVIMAHDKKIKEDAAAKEQAERMKAAQAAIGQGEFDQEFDLATDIERTAGLPPESSTPSSQMRPRKPPNV